VLTDSAFGYFLKGPDLPPAFEGQPLLYLVTVFAQMSVALLILEWLWRTAWAMKERPSGWKTPVTVSRVILMALLLTIAARGFGDLVFNMRYSELTPHGREVVATLDNQLEGLALLPFIFAWFLDRLGGGMIVYQLERLPIPLHLWPTWSQMRRPVKIGAGVFVLALTLTFLR
jgi:hypothetical protein